MEKDTPPKRLGSSASIRHSYESSLSACARLLAYATGEMPGDDSPIGQRQDVLAQEDLTTFAIHARRLVESTISTKSTSAVTVDGVYDGAKGGIPITRIFNLIIHHKRLEIHRTDSVFQVAMHFKKAGNIDPLLALDIKSNFIPAFCLVTSDRDNIAGFRIKDLVEIFAKEVLLAIISYCEERQLYLYDPLMD